MSEVSVKAKARFSTALADGTIIHYNPKFSKNKDFTVSPADARRMHTSGWIEDYKDPITGEKVTKETTDTLPVARLGTAPELLDAPVENQPSSPVSNAPKGKEAPTLPAGAVVQPQHTIKHAGGKYWTVRDAAGNQVGEKIEGKVEAQAEADTLNKLNAGPVDGVQQHPVGPSGGADTEHGNGELEPGQPGQEQSQGGDDDADSAPAS